MANRIGLLIISFVLLSSAIHFIACRVCKIEQKFKCGSEDCNCRYAIQDGKKEGLYRQFLALISPLKKVCDRCDVFCSEEKHINCEHGTCKQNECICHDCWSGEICSKYQNRQPEFKERYYVSEIKENANVGDEILKVLAFDADLETCADKKNCPCGRIKYSISKGNEDGLFHIDTDSGVISLVKKPSDQYHSQVTLSILAENEGDLNTVEDNQIDKSLATVDITVKTDEDVTRVRRSLHHRTRRSVTTYNSLVVTFEAETNKTFFPAGCTIKYRLYLVQNQTASPEVLSSITVQFSSENLDLSKEYSLNISNVVKTLGVNNDSFDAGKIQINITDSLPTNGSMEIKFNGSVRADLVPLTLLQVAFTMNATAESSGQVIYGPKYSTELYTTYPQIKLARTTQGVVEVETTLHYNVDVTLPYFNFAFALAITTILNDFRFLSIENVRLGNISNSVDAKNKNPSPTMYTGADDITSRVTLEFGNITVLDRNQSVNTIKLSFSVKVNDHHSLMNRSKFWIGIGSYAGSEMLGVTQDFIEIFKDEPYLFAEIKAIGITDPEVKTYFINDKVQFSWSVKHGNGSYETAKNVTVLFYIPTSLVYLNNSNKNGNVTKYSTSGKGVFKFTPNNTGNFSIGDTVADIITVKVSEIITPLTDLNVEIGIRYKTNDGKDRPFKVYKPDPGYIAGSPAFSVAVNPNTTKINIGQVVEISLKIIVKRIRLYGNLSVYLPDRKINATIMRFVTSESFTQAYGGNIFATNFDVKPFYSSSNGDKTYENNAKLDFGLIKNKDVGNHSTRECGNNTITLAFKVVLEDNDYVKNLSNYSVNIGMKTSDQTVWASKITFIANVASSRRPRVEIIASSNGSDSLNQGSVVEYNFTISHKTDSDAHAQDIEVVWMLPVYMKYRNVTQNKHQLTFTKLRDNVKFSLKKLEFGEKPFVSFTVEIDPEKTKTKSGKYYAVTPVALTYKKNQTYFEPLIPISIAFTVTISKKSKKIFPESISEESKKIFPESISEVLYNRGYLVDMSRSIVYICSVSLKRDKPSCFWTNTNGTTWQAVHVSVINIIGIDKQTKILYGIGNNKQSYMKYLPDKEKWFSMLPEMWDTMKSTHPLNNTVKIEDGHENESDPKIEKQQNMGNGEIWGANKLGLFHSSTNGAKWSRKACWDCFH